jgi:hypothetical protein
MQEHERKGQRLIALFIFGCLLFNYPVLSLFNVAAVFFGIPVLYAYIFAAWALLVALMALAVEARR